MDIPQALGLFTAMLLAALLAEPLARRLRLPFSALLVVFGFLGGQAVDLAGVDTGLRWFHFHDLVLFVLLPVILFESAVGLDARALLRQLPAVLMLAVPGMLLSTAVTAALLFYGIGHPTGFPWLAALLTGALLSATDPVAVLDLFRRVGAPKRLAVLVEGESLFNDGLAIVLFSLLLSLALGMEATSSPAELTARFLTVFLGGAAVGGAVGLGAAGLLRLVSGPVREGVVSLITAYLAFWLAEEVAAVSGVMAVLTAGLVLGDCWRRQRAGTSPPFLEQLWTWAGYIANALLFLLVGFTITTAMFSERWLAILLGIGAVLIARALAVYGGLGLISRLPGVAPVPVGQQTVIYWGGLRGAVTVALALSLPLELDYWWTIQSIAYGVVLFTLFVQAPSLSPLLRLWGRGKDR
jgi:CPA1 family monovalent cation:H+ antiporter